MNSLHDFTVDTIDGEPRSLADYRGKALLVVNVASKCGLTPQYKGLEELHRRYQAKGFSVLGFPCNQFAGQEPGTPEEIKQFCSLNYDVSFPLFAKIDVNGDARSPVYAFLTEHDTKPDAKGDIIWNFAKFLVDGEGKVVARFSPKVTPLADELVSEVERLVS
jgi:glutathione peroxidase